MRSFLSVTLLAAAVAATWSCGNETAHTETTPTDSLAGLYGEAFDTSKIEDVKLLPELYAQRGDVTYTVSGKMVECCQKKGCWMTLDMGEGHSPMRVTFKDYGFFMPLNSAGRSLVLSGIAMNDTTSVETLRHYAEDAGKSKEEIEAITEPEVELVFEATGVYIR
jgi:hypothetical protein